MKRRWWRLLGVGIIAVVTFFVIGATLLKDNHFDRIVDWSTILALPVGALGVWLALFPPRTRADRSLPEIVDSLTERVLEDEGSALNSLLYAGQSPGRAAELSFHPDIRFGVTSTETTSHPIEGTLGEVAQFYQEHTAGRMVILGAPGAGKTVLALTLLCQLARARQSLPDRERVAVPIRFDLVRWDPTRALHEWLSSELQERYGNLYPDEAEELIAQHLVLPILDGLDEADPEDHEPDRARAIVERLNRYVAGGNSLPLVVTCREHAYQRLGQQLADAVTVTVEPMSAADSVTYLERELPTDISHRALKILQAHSRCDEVWVLAGAPWILTLLAVYLRDGGPVTDLLPQDEEESRDFRARVTSLLLDRYVPARVRASSPDPIYTPDQVNRWVTALATHLGDGVDIQLDRVWTIGGYRLVRTLYIVLAGILWFAALCVIALSVNYWDVAYLVNRVWFSFAHPTQVPWQRLVGPLGASALFMTSIVRYVRSPQPRSSSPITLTALSTPKGRRRFIQSLQDGLVFGLVFGLVVGLVVGLAVGRVLGLVFGLVFGLVSGLMLGLTVVLTTGLMAEDMRAVSPSTLAYPDVTFGFVLGLVLGLTFGLTFGLVVGLVVGLMGVFFGNSESLRYLSGVAVASARGRLPCPLIPFLVWGVQVGLFRRSGPFYQFRHLSLRDHLQHKPSLSEEAAKSMPGEG